jgi:hypothetical protein
LGKLDDIEKWTHIAKYLLEVSTYKHLSKRTQERHQHGMRYHNYKTLKIERTSEDNIIFEVWDKDFHSKDEFVFSLSGWIGCSAVLQNI